MLFITLFFSSFAAWIAFWLNLALVLVAHKRIEDYTSDTLSGHIGNGLWMSLAGAVRYIAFLIEIDGSSVRSHSLSRSVSRDAGCLADTLIAVLIHQGMVVRRDTVAVTDCKSFLSVTEHADCDV